MGDHDRWGEPGPDDTICPGCNVLNPDCGWEDFGIGAYEYWGAPGVDVQMVWVTRCCETRPEPFRPEPDDRIGESEVA